MNKQIFSVSVIGLGYMGLPMAALLAKHGHTVHGVDINQKVVDNVNAGQCPFSEPGMAELVAEAHVSGKLKASTKPVAADVFILSLPTPVDHVSHAPDMAAVENGARSIAPVLKAGDLVVLESTSPVGATKKHVEEVIAAARPDLNGKIEYVFCPERAIPGSTLREMVANDRLIGSRSKAGFERTAALYGSFVTGALLPATVEEAEMVKMVENASRDSQIAFANELSLVCHELGLDVWKVIDLANHHPRVNILKPASGVGGHCIAVDPWFIINSAPKFTPMMRAARQVNDGKPYWVVSQVLKAALQTGKANAGVACLGLAYKPDVDDLRESPSIVVVDELAKSDLALHIVEPFMETWERPLSKLEDALKNSDIVVSLTAHSVFKNLPAGALAGKRVIDPCGIFLTHPDVLSGAATRIA